MTHAIIKEGPFRRLGFTKIEHELKPNGRLAFDIDGRPRGGVEQRIQGEIDPVDKGVIIGTIQLVARDDDPYAGCEEMGNGKNQIPESVAEAGWRSAVEKGRSRWDGIAKAKPKDAVSAELLTVAERQNELIYGVVQLANEALDLNIGPKNPLRYVAHQHVASLDATPAMVYAGVNRAWKTQDVTYVVAGPEPNEPLLALVGISNASFVQYLIEQFGNRLGIARLESIAVRRFGLDVYWYFA